MIELNNITKSFSNKIVLDNISIKITDGECIAVIGKSGIGKSVLLKHIIGLIKPDSGEIKIDGEAINSLSFRKLQEIRSSIGMVFQFGALFDSMNVYKNISLALEKFSKLSSEAISEKVSEVLKSVDMAGSELLMPSELSGGEMQRIAIARALVLKPSFLVLDEPTSSLDRTVQSQVLDLLRSLQTKHNLTYLFISHDLKIIQALCHDIIVMKDGIAVEAGPAEKILKQPQNPYTKTLLDAAL